MSRPLRIEYEGAWYHVMNRGANHQDIFKLGKHREIFLSIINEAVQLFSVELHAYCLMGNHYHLLLRTPFANLGRVMRHINGVFTQYINRLEKKDGPLFRGRYKAILVESERYLLNVSRYIHLNPVEARVVSLPHLYAWSSLRAYLGLEKGIAALRVDFILSMLDGSKSYDAFHQEGLDQDTARFYCKKFTSPIMGTRSFVASQVANVDKHYREACSSDFNRVKKLPTLERILEEVARYFDVTPAEIRGKIMLQRNVARMLSIYLARYVGQMTYKQISSQFSGINISGVASAVRRCAEKIRRDDDLNRIVRKMIDSISVD